MVNYIFNNMNAHEIADAIIKREEAYLDVDFDTLGFEEQCQYALDHVPYRHPLCSLGKNRGELIDALLPTIKRRAQESDGAAACYLALFAPSFEQRGALLERAMELGSLTAHIYYADWLIRKDEARARKVAREALELCSLGDIDAPDAERDLYNCYAILAGVGETEDERSHYKRLYDELALKRVLRGEFAPLTHLCVKNRCAMDAQTGEYRFDDETLFWKTVSFLAEYYFYDKWGQSHSGTLGVRLLRGIGCDVDLEKGKRFFLDMYFRKSVSSDAIVNFLGMCDATQRTVEEKRESLREKSSQGDGEGYEKLILLGILTKDADFVESVCDEAIERGRAKAIFRAYNKLLQL